MRREPSNPGAQHHLKRRNFIAQATEHFRFLCVRHGYTGPEHTFTQQANGSITSDALTYTHPSIDRLIVLRNAYHPVDYGFEVQFYRSSISTQPADGVLVFGVLKEDQDVAQSYLEKAARAVKDRFTRTIDGHEWEERPNPTNE